MDTCHEDLCIKPPTCAYKEHICAQNMYISTTCIQEVSDYIAFVPYDVIFMYPEILHNEGNFDWGGILGWMDESGL